MACLTIALTFAVFRIYSEPRVFFSGLLAVDPFASYCKALVIFSALFITVGLKNKPGENINTILILLMSLGAVCGISSAGLVMMFASMEVTAISAYILLASSGKISYKYFTYSAVCSGLMLYGISLLYGMAGTADYSAISSFLSANTFNELTLTISIILITAGLGFKMLLFPFNFIMPQLAENISAGKLGLITVIPVITGIAVIARLLLTVFHETGSFISDESTYLLISSVKWQALILIISLSSVVTGSLIILWQKNLKRIFSFVLIAQSGYLLIPLSSPSPQSTETILVNLFSFTINSLGLLLCINILTEKLKPAHPNNLELDDLKSLGKKSPFVFACLLIFLASAAGFPFTSGFIGRLYIYTLFGTGFFGDYQWAAAIAVLSSMGFLYFIFKSALLIFSGSKSLKSFKLGTIHKFMLLLCVLPNLFFGFYPAPVINLSKYCLQIFGI